MAIVALAFAVLELGSATDLGLVLLAREIPMVVLVLLGGVFADRVPRRLILVVCDLMRGTAQATTAGLLFAGSASVWNVALLQAAFGLATAFSRPATTGIVREAVRDPLLQEANALLSLARSSFSVVGPALGGLIVAAANPAWALAADGATFFASALLIASMRLVVSQRVATGSLLRDLRDGWREFVARSWLVAIVVAAGIFQLTFFPALLVLGPVVAKDELGGAGVWGTILALQSAGALAGALVVLRLRFGRPLVATMLAVLPAGVMLAMLAVPLPVAAIALTSFLVGVGFAVGGTLWDTSLQRNVPEHALSRVSSFDWLGSIALNPIGYALVGPLSAAIGIAETLALSACLNVAASLGVLLVPSVRELRAETKAAELGPATGQAFASAQSSPTPTSTASGGSSG